MKMAQIIYGLLITAVMIGLSPMAAMAASNSPAPAQAYTLGEVVVSLKKVGVESVGTVREITAEDIEITGAETLDEALAMLPGLSIKTGGSGVPRIDIRGLRSRHIVLLLDGIPFNSTNDGQFDPTLIPVESIARIKVSYGNHSVLYGDGGLAGTINIITKRGADKVRAQATIEAGERDRWLEKVSLSGGNDKVNFFASGSILNSDGYPLSDDFEKTKFEDGDLRLNSDKERRNVFLNLGFTPSDALNIGFVINYLDGEYGIPPNVLDSKKDPFANNQKYDRVDDQEGISAQLSASYDLPGPVDIRGSVYINELDEESNRYDDETYSTQENLNLKGLFHQNSETRITGGNLQINYDLAKAGAFTVGLGTKKEEFDADGWTVEKKGKQTDFDESAETKTHSFSCEYEVVPFKDIGMVAGYSHHWFDKDSGDDEDQGSFIVGSHYDITEQTRLGASFARKIRFPSIRQLYDKDDGNTDLTEEKSDNWEVAITHRFSPDTRISITGFHMDVEDYIEKDDDTPYLNHDEYRFKGIEFSAETRAVKNLMLRAGYTYMESEDRSDGSGKDELQYRPEHKLSLEANYSFAHGFSTYIGILHEADQYTYSRSTPLEKRKMSDYTLVDLRVEKEIAGSVRLYVGVDNLFDHDYEESYGLPREGRLFYGGIRITH